MNRLFSRRALAIILLGLIARIVIFWIYPPSWKLHAAFNVETLGVLKYISNFQGYKPSRMPFFDVFALAFYYPLSGVLGAKALSTFNMVVSVLSIPFFYLTAKKYITEVGAVFALTIFALYPKLIVMSVTGLPEVASVGFVVISLNFATVAVESEDRKSRLRILSLSGFFSMMSFLMYVPTVLYSILLGLYIFKCTLSTYSPYSEKKAIIIENVSYNIAPLIGGLSYAFFGPIRQVLNSVAANDLSVFTNPEAYSVIEKFFWYISYSYFDFWWHLRGFDRERGIRPLIGSLQSFLGEWFSLYISGWIGITLLLSILVLVGIVVLLKSERRGSVLFATWIVAYVIVFNYKNMGWVGGFQTRHVFPIFPALAIAFGFGGNELVNQTKRISEEIPNSKFLESIWSRDRGTDYLHILVVIGLAILLVNGAVQGTIRGGKIQEDTVDPIHEIKPMVVSDSVGVILGRSYHNMVLNTENEIRPVIIAGPSRTGSEVFVRYGGVTDIQVVNESDLSDSNVEYLFLRTENSYLERQPFTINMTEDRLAKIQQNNSIVYHDTIRDGPFRTTGVDIYLIRLDSE